MEGIISLLLGLVCIVIGILNVLGNVSMLHAYHRKRVSAEDLPAFARLVGIGTILCGVGILMMGIFTTLAKTLAAPIYETIGSGILIGALVIGLGISFFAMIKYNKGIF